MGMALGMGWGGLGSIVMEKGAGKPMAERLPESMDSNGVKSPNGFMVLALVF
ncbi:hypothetical protein [Eikenella corrodens]|uniref:hypothetical protein n=1 Tax=Eikenella corrodens TaxID=539 RepID=UPI00129B616E|nr:hypothetical protein [Eikenella corrodens]MDU4300471.1 hypothetical protein [Eikenella corrodens]